MPAPSSDKAAIRQTIRALKAADHTLISVEYGDDEREDVSAATEDVTIAAIMAVDDAHVVVKMPDGNGRSFVRFVMGNEPFEVICDHGVSLSPVLDPLTDGWQE